MRSVLALALAAALLAGCGSDQDDYCAAVEEHQERLSELAASGEPDALLGALDVFRELRDQAPSDVRDEWRQVIEALSALSEALEEAGVDPATYDPQDPPPGLSAEDRERVETAATLLGSPETARALEDLDQQARDVCHTPLTL